MFKKFLLVYIAIAAIGIAAFAYSVQKEFSKSSAPSSGLTPTLESKKIDLADIPAVSVFAENLEIPWSIVFLPDNRMLATERHGTVRIISTDGKISDPIATINVKNIGEGGLLGITLDPDFNSNSYVYLYYTYSSTGNDTLNRVSRFTLENEKLTNEKVIVDKIPGASNHNGGRIKFGPDGFLYITTGDAEQPSQAQNRDSLSGKILRVTRDGDPAPGNPFNTRIYSYGHRNPQGIAWDNNGKLWATEHGRSGALSGLDELNQIQPGKNYGWPTIQGDETRDGMITPILNSGKQTWAPGGIVYLEGKLYFVGLRGNGLYEVNQNSLSITKHLENYGRLRDIVIGPDGLFYITTSNRDGRGSPSNNDDKILRVNPQKINEL